MRTELLGAFIDPLTMGQFVENAARYIERKDPCFIITLNPELLYRAQREKALLGMINRADMVTADGAGIIWACRTAGIPLPERVAGVDLMMRLLESAAEKGWRVFLLGSARGVAEAAAQRAVKLFPGLKVAGTCHGYFSEDQNQDVVGIIKSASPDLLFVALGSPRQEKWIEENFPLLGSLVAVGVGGSLDVLSGNAKRAPEWVRRLNLEWLARLLREPRRWRRMLVLPRFMLTVLVKYKIRKFLVR